MFQLVKKIGLAVVLALAMAGSSYGFSLTGPINEAFQVVLNGYNVPGTTAPKNLGEGYRWNLPLLFYAYDANFLDYFGANGVQAVDQAIGILNNLKPASDYTRNIAEVPLVSSRINYTAQALGMLDLKSVALSVLVSEMGLDQPERYIWCLHDRWLPPGAACPAYVYQIVQRNFDPVTHFYSSYVNGVLYDYEIIETCPAGGADAVEIPVDLTSYSQGYLNSVASISEAFENYGLFFNGLTRDDVGGLRYLYSATNVNTESVSGDSQMLFTNLQAPFFLVTDNLTALSAAALTNSPAQLLALFPTLAINSFTNYVTNVVSTNVTAYYIGPNAIPPVLLITNFSTNALTNYVYSFANVVTNHLSYTSNLIVIQVTNVSANPFQQILFTNQVPQLLVTSNLNQLAADALVSPSNVLQTLYPNLIINSNATFFSNVITTNYIVTFTPPPNAPATALIANITTNLTTNFAQFYTYWFANVVTNHYTNRGALTVQATTTTFYSPPHSPAGYGYVTNLSVSTTFAAAETLGDYYIVPPGIVGYDFVATLLTNVIRSTNTLISTNVPGTTNLVSLATVISFTNYDYIVYPIIGIPGPVQTNITSTTNLGNFITGDYYIIPPNDFGYRIVNTQLTNVTIITNTIQTATNAPGVTATNLNFTENILTFFTNYEYYAYPIQLLGSSNTVALRPGIEKINFVRQDFDPLLSELWTPITNFYTLASVSTNGAFQTNTFMRVLNSPDILFSCQDLVTGPDVLPLNPATLITVPHWNTNQSLANLAGPGTLSSGKTLGAQNEVIISFNKSGPTYFNPGPFFIGLNGATFLQTNSLFYYYWGSFDGRTNAPILYPSDVSLANLEAQAFFQITTSILPNGSKSAGTNYLTQLKVQGGQPPYTWMLPAAPHTTTNGFPPGLHWANPVNTATNVISHDGIISGIPTNSGIYDFIVTVSFSPTNTVPTATNATAELFIEIDP